MPEIWLDRLIAAEQIDRKARRLNYQLHTAKFPHHRDLIHFDWTENPLTKGCIGQLATGEFMIQANNLILVAVQELGKPIWALPWRFQQSIRENACVFITPLIWSIN